MKKIWSTAKADIIFSKFIRERDRRCIRCGKKEYLQCSHFWSRGNSSTRYRPENADTLCYGCHYGNSQGWEYNKQGEYRNFKLQQLGKEGYAWLEKRATSVMKREAAIKEFMELFHLAKPNLRHIKKSSSD